MKAAYPVSHRLWVKALKNKDKLINMFHNKTESPERGFVDNVKNRLYYSRIVTISGAQIAS